jgi:hypothetical protein
MSEILAVTSDIMGVKTDDLLAHILVYLGAVFWGGGIVGQLLLRRFVDEERLRSAPDLKKHVFRPIPPDHLLTPRGRRVRRFCYVSMGIGAAVFVLTGIYVHTML